MEKKFKFSAYCLTVLLYIFLCQDSIERTFGKYPYVFIIVLVTVVTCSWLAAIKWKPKALFGVALFAPLVASLISYGTLALILWAENGHLFKASVVEWIFGWLFSSYYLAKVWLLSLFLLVPAFWGALTKRKAFD